MLGLARNQEMKLLAEADKPGSLINNYVTQLSCMLSSKATNLVSLQARLSRFHHHLKEILSHKRTSVLAATNPPSGRYDDLKTAQDNIDLQTTILSRFDLIFIVKDINMFSQDKMVENLYRFFLLLELKLLLKTLNMESVELDLDVDGIRWTALDEQEKVGPVNQWNVAFIPQFYYLPSFLLKQQIPVIIFLC
uniref:MCM C-terminal AAA(+) ATPase domain-containing protein n=1 Tax=Lactuca sativa TaxID=4236 RepID=A0A9R1W6M1_LACSA|nr:hypothetical protein LSAT_V11C300141340 [Lactuca sativa]